jgi:hypothetical protein
MENYNSHSAFPSYEEMYLKIKAQEMQHSQRKLLTVTNKISKLKSKVDFSGEHRRLAK